MPLTRGRRKLPLKLADADTKRTEAEKERTDFENKNKTL